MERSSQSITKKGILFSKATGSHIIIENGQGLWTSVPRKNELGKGLLL
jgi:predicted RNA binding protein YcfA (HicA-like mRNA interferase family)